MEISQTPVTASVVAEAPYNLPVVTDTSILGMLGTEESVEKDDLSDFEILAQSKGILFSSDALRYSLNEWGSDEEKLEEVIEAAKATYPTEDGWLVVDLSKAESLIGSMKEKVVTGAEVESVSLAEAILSGNVEVALAGIEERPMLSLAEAVSDIDKMYRDTIFRGDTLAAGKMKAIISVLSTAIDGTYTDEKLAVRTAVMKAVTL